MEKEEELVESFKKLRMTNTNYVILVRNEGDTVEMSPERKPPPGPSSTSSQTTTTSRTPAVAGKVRVKGIDKMTVEELKGALKKRRLKGLGGMRKEELVEKLKKEVRSQTVSYTHLTLPTKRIV